MNDMKYPNLAAISKDILAIQVRTVASESCFSIRRRLIDLFSSSIIPKTVEALICYQNWIKFETIHNIQYVPTIEDMEFYESAKNEHANKECATVDPPNNPSTSRSSKASKNVKTADATKAASKTAKAK